MRPLILLVIASLLFNNITFGQQSRGRSWASPPIDSVLVLSGNFGEPRSNHFHSGIDIKTNGEIGWPVYVADQGNISRIKVSSGGFGKVVYIDHPGNITSVYAHLHAFSDPIAELVRSKQLENGTFEVEIFPKPGSLTVTKGEKIGFTGNSGSTGGPHLHYEYRNTDNQKPFDPGLMGVVPPDTILPKFKKLFLYRPGEFNGIFGAERLELNANELNNGDTINLDFDSVFLGFTFEDKANGADNHLGLRSYELLVNNDQQFIFLIDSFSYSETRFMNSLIDYPYYKSNNQFSLLCYKLPGNKLPHVTSDNPIIIIEKDSLVSITLRISDRANNQNHLNLYIKRSDQQHQTTSCMDDGGIKVKYDNQFRYSNMDVSINFKPYTFYDDVRIRIEQNKNEAGNKIFRIGHEGIAAHKKYTLKIRQEEYEEKVAIVSVTKVDTIWLNTTYEKPWLITQTREMGEFIIESDKISPAEPLKYVVGIDSVLNKKTLTFNVSDNMSGINKITATVNDSTYIVEYNSTRKESVLYLDESELKEENLLKVNISDMAGNIGTYTHIFTIN